jgi:hypothetical protein
VVNILFIYFIFLFFFSILLPDERLASHARQHLSSRAQRIQPHRVPCRRPRRPPRLAAVRWSRRGRPCRASRPKFRPLGHPDRRSRLASRVTRHAAVCGPRRPRPPPPPPPRRIFGHGGGHDVFFTAARGAAARVGTFPLPWYYPRLFFFGIWFTQILIVDLFVCLFVRLFVVYYTT